MPTERANAVPRAGPIRTPVCTEHRRFVGGAPQSSFTQPLTPLFQCFTSTPSLFDVLCVYLLKEECSEESGVPTYVRPRHNPPHHDSMKTHHLAARTGRDLQGDRLAEH